MQSIDEIIESFELIDDWEERYAILIDLGKKLPHFPENDKTEANLVKGCVSKVWMIPKQEGETFFFLGDSDAHIVRGLVGLLYVIYSGKKTSEIKNIDINGIFDKLGLIQNLSPNRRNGVFSMVETIRSFATL